MKLTALDIKQQSFDKTFRGYDAAEVQAFLSLVSNEWEHLVAKNNELEKQIEKLNDKLKHYERVEEALHETLQTARDSAEQKLEGAKKESQNIIEKAEMEADAIIREASQQRQQIRQSIMRLLDRRKEIVGGIRSYLEIAQESIQQFSSDEANLFSMPKEEDVEFEKSRDGGGFKLTRKEGEEQLKKKEEPHLPPGSEEMDDILDEID
jgi:cell division initiation protein